ncbi:AAA+ superfamily ATPase [Candidatus Mancarchaeum acidiphilum]|uniref:AAA+ superfamily ATPase n=1 Tax=Candidatus Mancarchaeum acidiphilum TaxID=1920749 RepID=A0A218NM28_9ARCH|nr:ATP-binding protein [Candidatus Mancarchaeum acidiphilum]ASI13519.1 AAA+ superfamily ATPase [Candidatus Mancarchaeum acidiphilum]
MKQQLNDNLLSAYNPWWSSKYRNAKKTKYLAYYSKLYKLPELKNGQKLIITNTDYNESIIKQILYGYVNRRRSKRNMVYVPFENLGDSDVISIFREIKKSPSKLDVFVSGIDPYLKFSLDKGKLLFSTINNSKSIKKLFISTRFLPSSTSNRHITKLSTGAKHYTISPITFRDYILKFGKHDIKGYLASLPIIAKSNPKYMEKIYLQACAIRDSGNESFFKDLFSSYSRSGGFISSIVDYKNKEDLYDAVYNYRKSLMQEFESLKVPAYDLEKLLFAITNSCGSIYTFDSMESDTKLPKRLVMYYYKLLLDLGIIKPVLKFDIKNNSPTKLVRKTYLSDPITYIAFSDFYNNYNRTEILMQGPLIENIVGVELMRRFGQVYTLKEGVEVDFFLPSMDLGIEVKSGSAKYNSYHMDFPRNRVVFNSNRLKKENGLFEIPYYLFLALM